MINAPITLVQRTVSVAVTAEGGINATVVAEVRQISAPIQSAPSGGGDGVDGADGHSPVLTWVGDQIAVDGVVAGPHLTGPQGVQGNAGTNGNPGANGNNGADGHSPVVTLSGDQIVIDGITQSIHLTGPQGLQGVQGVPGTDGAQGIQGIQGIQGVPGADGGTSTAYKSFSVAMAVAMG